MTKVAKLGNLGNTNADFANIEIHDDKYPYLCICHGFFPKFLFCQIIKNNESKRQKACCVFLHTNFFYFPNHLRFRDRYNLDH